MLYMAFGVEPNQVPEMMQKVIPVLQEAGVKHDLNSCVALPSVILVDASGKDIRDGSMFCLPAFIELRQRGGIQEVTNQLSLILGMLVYCLNAEIIAAYRGNPI
jgi:hypothetical protein